MDSDQDVDLRDSAAQQRCFTGSSGSAGFVPPTDADCLTSFDTDGDGDVDLVDYSFLGCAFRGPGTTLPAVNVVEPASPTRSTILKVSGTAAGWPSVEIVRGASTAVVTVDDCSFSASIELLQNRVNQIFVRGVLGDGTTSAPTALHITQDEQAPSLFIDFPADESEITTPTTDIAGRVGDTLSGFDGLSVLVNGRSAEVDIGIGTNGTFFLPGLRLNQGGVTPIEVVASDVLGNTTVKRINVSHVPVAPNAPQMTVVSGNGQTGQVATLLAQPIVVQITRGDGTPFANKLVTFDVTRSNGRLTVDGLGDGAITLQAFTDSNGLAQAFWRVGLDAGCGNNRVEVTSTDIAGTTVLCASATPAPAAQINVGSGNNQRAEVGGLAPEPLRAWVSDACNGVPGVDVQFTIVGGGGLVNGQKSVRVATGPTGHAEVALTLGLDPGNNFVLATFDGNPGSRVRFNAVGVARNAGDPTSFSGIVLDNAEQPVQGATCMLNVAGQQSAPVQTDLEGVFRFGDVPGTGPADLIVDGATAFHVGGATGRSVLPGSFPALHYEPILIPNAVNALPTPIYLPELNPTNDVLFDNTADVELTVDGIEGLKMIVSAGSMTLADGTVPSPASPATIRLNQVRHEKIPMPLPDGAAPPFAWTLQPAGATFDPPVKIVYPNMSGLAPGSIAYFLSFNHDTIQFEIVATGSVTDDGNHIVSDPGVGIDHAGWGCNCPPYEVTTDACFCGPCARCVDGVCVPVDDPCCGLPPGSGCDLDEDTCTVDKCLCSDGGTECIQGSCLFTGLHFCPACAVGSDPLPCDDGDPCTGDGFCEIGFCRPGASNCSCAGSGGEVCGDSECSFCDEFGNCIDPCVAGEECCDGACSETPCCEPPDETCGDDCCLDGLMGCCDAQACCFLATELCCNGACCDAVCQICDGVTCAPRPDASPECCGPNGPQPSGTPCDDGDPCTIGDECINGDCIPGDSECNAANCETCDGAGACVGCDSDACKICLGGRCEVRCNPNDCLTCNGAGSCVSDCDAAQCQQCDGAGSCSFVCEDRCCDADACKICLGGRCEVRCDPAQCLRCDGAGACVPGCDIPGFSCFCGLCEICLDGKCVPDIDPCCDQPDGTPCDDGDPCTDDACSGGSCAGTPLDCSFLDDACSVGICNPALGVCDIDPRNEG
ncbi:MAG: hypothetical protein ACE5HE_12535, partial [Phycisphaerae bacterium]